MQQMGAGVIRLYSATALGVDPRGYGLAGAKLAALDFDFMKMIAGDHGVRVFDRADDLLAFEYAGVANLSTGFSIKGTAIKPDLALLTSSKPVSLLIADCDCQNARACGLSFLISSKGSLRQSRGQAGVDRALATSGGSFRN